MSSLLEVGLVNAAMATGLAMIVWLATRIWRHPVLVHTLWIFVLLKLITPPLVNAPWQLTPITAENTNALRSFEQESVAFAPIGMTARVLTEPHESMLMVRPQSEAIRVPAHVQAGTSAILPITWTTAATAVWLTGTFVYLLLSVVRLLRFHRAMSQTSPAPIDMQQFAAELAARFGVTNRYQLRVTEGQLSPLVWPIGRPTILMPRRLLLELSPEEVETLLAHEFAHLCRRDHWLRWLELVVTAIYWWHPVVWWAKAAIQRAEEKACDAWVLSGFPDASARYASALFKAIQFSSADRQAAPVMASALGGHDLKERIEHIMNATWKPRLYSPVRWFVLIAAILILPLSLRAADEEDKATQPVVTATETTEDAKTASHEDAAATADAAVDAFSETVDSTAAESADAATTDSLTPVSSGAASAATTTNPFDAQPAAGARPGMQPRRVSVPADPYNIAPGDVLFVSVAAGGAGRPVIDRDFVVEPSGSVALGPHYGRAKIGGLSLEDAEKAVATHLKQTLRDPMVQITIGGWQDRTTSRRTGSPSIFPREARATSEATLSPEELAKKIQPGQTALLPWETQPFPWETQQQTQTQVSPSPPSTTYRDLISTAASPSITESIDVLKRIVQRSQQDYYRAKELAEKGTVSTTEVARARSEYDINIARLRQGERALRYHRAVLAVAEADYQVLDEARQRAPGSVSESDLRRAMLAVELAKAKLEELAE